MPDHLSLHTTNSSATAYCHFVYKSHFFSRYRLKSNGGLGDDEDVVEERPVEGQLSTKVRHIYRQYLLMSD